MSALRIGTRGSALALAQAGWIADALGVPAELVTIRTSGDRGADELDKSRWVDTIEAALLAGDVDLAVHSAKDVPGDLAPGTTIAAVPVREDAADVLLAGDGPGELARGARIGTASLRRRAQLLAWRPDLAVQELRGNVDTRVRKWREGQVDALVLARAGLARLQRPELDDAVALWPALPGAATAPVFVPAPGQGALVVQAREEDEAALAAGRVVDDVHAHACLSAERAAVAVLGATCRTPVGVHADGDTVRGFVGMPDGSAWVTDEVDGSDGAALAQRLLAAGGGDILGRLEAAA